MASTKGAKSTKSVQPKMAKAPRKAKAPPPKAIYKAIDGDNAATLKEALAAGFDPNTLFDPTAKYGARTPLSHAAHRDAIKCVNALIVAGADVNKEDERGGTPIIRASAPRIIDALAAAGADLNARDGSSYTALHRAAEISVRAWLERLLHHGADASLETEDGERAADLCEDPKLVELLAKHGGGRSAAKPPETLAATITEVTWAATRLIEGKLAVDRDGVLWLAGYAGIHRFDGTRLERFDFGEHHIGSIERIVPSPTGEIYFGCTTGLLRSANHVFTFYNLKQGLPADFVHSAATDHAGRVCMVLRGDPSPIAVLDGGAVTTLDVPEHEFEHVAFLADGRIALACDDALVIGRAGQWETKTKLAGTTLEYVWDIASSGDTLWLATGDGLIEIRPDGSDRLHDLPEMPASVFADVDEVWVGLESTGVARLRDGKLTVFTPESSPLPSPHVKSIARARDGVIWMCAGEYVARVTGDVMEALNGPPPKPAKKKR